MARDERTGTPPANALGRRLQIRDLVTIEDFRQVIALEIDVWGYPDPEEATPVSLLAATARRGAILVGAFDQGRLVGAVYSVPAFARGRVAHWSHLLAVRAAYRNAGVGRVLKLEQRRRAIDMGLDLIEWTYDPLQSVNAYLNFNRLGVVVEVYEQDAYGRSASPLSSGTATDRFVAQWNLLSPHVERRVRRDTSPALRAAEVFQAVPINEAAGEVPRPGPERLDLWAPRLTVTIPTGFTDLQAAHPDVARKWRASTRRIFSTYLSNGYRVVDFWLDRQQPAGRYLLTRTPHDIFSNE
jgi:predicted GNAT superfamily acetyltransferase